MFAPSVLLASLISDTDWRVPLAGLAGAAVVVLIGYLLVLRRQLRPALPARSRRSLRPRSDPFTYGSATERRESFRRKGARVKVQLRDASARADLGTAWVVDRCLGGVCLEVDRDFDVGIILSVRPVSAPVTMPWVQIEVKSCRARDDGHEVGCRFVRAPTWNMLLLFG